MDGQHIQLAAQLATSIATVITLIFLTYQISLLKKSIKINTQQSVMKDERELWEMAINTQSVMRGAFAKEKWKKLNPNRSANENLFISMLIDHFEKVYYLYSENAFPDSLWESWEAHITETLAMDSVFPSWEASKHVYWREFSEFFSERIYTIRKKK